MLERLEGSESDSDLFCLIKINFSIQRKYIQLLACIDSAFNMFILHMLTEDVIFEWQIWPLFGTFGKTAF